ncbi:DC-STAMP domain-containing protein 2 isoform X3 [Paralichthys olivaceus]|uniref:DC-STAMP domain-containing protein 2 isoform X3 n=1 Tax=Paralichthys olivaceus TaxID=8255 RepID=UPI003751F617
MATEERKRRLMTTDITVQVAGGGVMHTVRGVLSRLVVHRSLHRSAGRSRLCSWRKVKGHLLEGEWSLAGFVCGLVLGSVYGVTALFLQNQPLWFCVYTMVAVAFLAAFGMGLSAGVRADVMVMLPSLCSARGRHFLLFLFVSVLFSGPIANMLENTERAAASLLCGAELAANQTQELMQRATTPLSSALVKIREIRTNAYSVAERVTNFIHALTDGVQHIARTLRNVLHFLTDIGDVCNTKLGAPYRKCRAVFTEARVDCCDLLGDFSALCDIVESLMPLCNIARAGEFFCIIPSYIANHLKKRLAAPIVAVFEQMKQEFEFNISASVTFDLDANSSKSLQQMSQDVMDEVSSDLQVTSGGGVSVLPITRKEAKTYITPLSLHLSNGEWRVVLVGVVSVLKHLVVGSLLVALDFLVFWILDQVRHQVTGDVVARAPVTVAVQVNGSGFASDIFRDLVASFNILQGGNVTVISRKCLLEPSEPNYNTCVTLGFLLGLALLISLSGGFVQRCRRLICASYHPGRELERIQFLRKQILSQRRAEGEALRRSAIRNLAEEEGGGEGGGGSRLKTILLRLPGGAHLSHLLGLSSPVSCLACEEVVRSKDNNMVVCHVTRCTGVYCRPCFQSLGNMCVVCTRPLTFQEDSEEELDSSDDEQLSPRSAATRRGRTERSECGVRAKDDGGHDSELSEADMTDQGSNRVR